MLVLRNLSFIASIAILSLSAVLVSEAQTETSTSSSEIATATTSTSTEQSDFEEPTEVAAPEVSGGMRVTLQTRAQDRIIKLAANINNRFDATTGRFSHIITRLESRISKLNGAGIDTSSAVTELRAAQASLAEAKQMLSDIDTVVYEAVTSESPKTTWPAVKTNLREVHVKLLATQTSLRDVIAALKNASVQTENSGEVAPTTAAEIDGANDIAPENEPMN